MVIDLTQIIATAVATAITSTFATLTTVVIMRYAPRVLDTVEKAVGKNGNGHRKED